MLQQSVQLINGKNLKIIKKKLDLYCFFDIYYRNRLYGYMLTIINKR